MLGTDLPTRDELVRRASELVPLLQENALWTEQNRRLHPDSIQALADAGFFRMRVPRRYGGYECAMRTLVDVLCELAQGDGATAWTTAVWQINAWIISLFPDEVQDEVFATPDARFCGILSPTATVTPTDGGYLVNGQWGFNSGFLHSDWNMLSGMHVGPDEEPYPVITVIPTARLDHVDDWHTSGLRGTGSVTTVAKDVFVPERFVLPMGPVLMGQYPTRLNAHSPIYRPPLLQAGAVPMNGVMVGLAEAAMSDFRRRLPQRKITYTSYESQREAPITHLQVADAATRIDLARFHAYRAADLLDTKGVNDEAWTLEERARILLDAARTCTVAKEAVDILNNASGGSSIYSDVPIQRIERDMQAVKLHGLQHTSTNLELYGRILCGLEPNTFFI
jgi:3-hydroxy-9,10-secoandrosta-1,3,5(10)-triene-9,17-dione monooxygenase